MPCLKNTPLLILAIALLSGIWLCMGVGPISAGPSENTRDILDEGLKNVGGKTFFDSEQALQNEDSDASISLIAGTFVGIVLGFVGVLFFLLVTYGGIRWLIAAGNEPEVEKARTLIINSAIGMFIALAAFVITATITNRITEIFKEMAVEKPVTSTTPVNDFEVS